MMNVMSGDIKNMVVPWLLQDLRTQKKTGIVVLSREKETKKVFFRNGDIIYASSNLDAEQLGTSLLRSGKLTEEMRTASEEAAKQTGKQLSAVLLERGLITPKDLIEGAKLQVTQIILSLFSWSDGRYTFDNAPMLLAEIVPLQIDTGNLLLEGIRHLDWRFVRKSLPPLKMVLRAQKDSSSLLHGIVLDQDQQTIFSFIDGSRSIEEICALSEIGDFNTLKAIYALNALRLVELLGLKSEPTTQERNRSAPAGREKEEPTVKVTRELLRQTMGKMADLDYYQILDVGRNATLQEIKKAYFHLAMRYHPDRHMDSELSDMREQLAAIFTTIAEAYNVLNADDKRKAYDLSLAKRIKKRWPTALAKNQQDNIKKGSAMSQFNEGLKHYRGQNFWGAEESFRWAVLLDPSNAQYLFHHGLALTHMPRRLHDAEKLFQKAIKMAPSKIEYYLELGNLYSRNGLKKQALSLFQDALQRHPDSDELRQAMKNVGG